MAKEAKPEAEDGDVAKAPPQIKSKKLLIVVVAAVVLTMAIVGSLTFILMKGHSAQNGEEEEAISETQKEKKKKDSNAVPVYIALDAFTVNLVPENGDQFLQLIISVEVADFHVGDKLKSYAPKLRNNVMLLLSGKKASELITREGKENLANEIRDLINEILEPDGNNSSNELPVKEVLFTSFIIQ